MITAIVIILLLAFFGIIAAGAYFGYKVNRKATKFLNKHFKD